MTDEIKQVEDSELMAEVQVIETKLRQITVTNQEERERAIEIGRDSKNMIKKIQDWFAPAKKAAHDAHKAVVNQENQALEGLKRAQSEAKRAILGYDAKMELLRREQQAKLQREAEEQARKERERLEKEAARLKTPELKQERLEMAQEIVAPVVEVASVIERSKGESYRSTWRAEVTDKKAVPREWLIVNEQALNSFARSTKGQVQVAGVRFIEDKQLVIK